MSLFKAYPKRVSVGSGKVKAFSELIFSLLCSRWSSLTLSRRNIHLNARQTLSLSLCWSAMAWSNRARMRDHNHGYLARSCKRHHWRSLKKREEEWTIQTNFADGLSWKWNRWTYAENDGRCILSSALVCVCVCVCLVNCRPATHFIVFAAWLDLATKRRQALWHWQEETKRWSFDFLFTSLCLTRDSDGIELGMCQAERKTGKTH